MDGSMFLIELIEIKHRFSGIDLGINFIHEYLSLPTTIKRVGVVVIFPWTISCNMLRYDDNKKRLKDGKDGKSENEKVDISRSDTIKLRRQVSRMGFSAVHSSHPDFVDLWFLSLDKYKRLDPMEIKNSWLSKEESSQLDIPISGKLYVLSDVDKELKRVLESVMPDYDYYGYNGRTMNAMQQSTQSLQQSWSDLFNKHRRGNSTARYERRRSKYHEN